VNLWTIAKALSGRYIYKSLFILVEVGLIQLGYDQKIVGMVALDHVKESVRDLLFNKASMGYTSVIEEIIIIEIVK
jgi:hypothetical protein